MDAATPDGQLLLGIFGNPALNPVGLALALAFAGCTLGPVSYTHLDVYKRQELGFSCLDTGAMYRAIAWRALQDGVALDDEPALGAIARTYDIAFGHVEGDPVPRRVFIGDDEVTDAIRTAEIRCV